MGIRIAVASSDGKRVDEHFGRCRRFMVFDFEGGEWRHRETRDSLPVCAGGEHRDDLLAGAVELVADCRLVAVRQIGPTAIDLLLARRVLPFTFSGPVTEALAVVADRYSRTDSVRPS